MDDDLTNVQVEELLSVALDAVHQAKVIMSCRGRKGESHRNIFSSNEFRSDLIVGRYANLVARRSLPRIGRTGQKGAKILLRLLDEPDHYISHSALATAANIRSQKNDAIKVYVCYIRNALEDEGYSPDIIETGRCSYRVGSGNIEEAMDFLLKMWRGPTL